MTPSDLPPRLHRAALGHADLLRLLVSGAVPEDAAAGLCGFERRPVEAAPEPPPLDADKPGAQGDEAHAPGPAPAAAEPALQAAIFAVTHWLAPSADAEAPSWLDEPGPVMTTIPQADRRLEPPRPRALVPQRRLAAFLRRQLRRPAPSAQIDIDGWVGLIASGRPLPARLPRRRLPSWRSPAALLIHDHAWVAPLNEDLHALARAALRLSGGAATVCWLGPERASVWQAQPRHGGGPGGRGDPLRWLERPATALNGLEHVVWAGAAGALDGPGADARWRAWLRRRLQARAGLDWLLAGEPPTAEWRLPHGVPLLRWDHGSRLRPQPLRRQAGGDADMARLLAAMSLAVCVEPALLRALRLELGLPLGAELAAWQHPDVETFGVHGCQLRPPAVARHRAEAARQGLPFCTRMARLIQGLHRHLSPLIQMEEAGVAQALGVQGAAAESAISGWQALARALMASKDGELGQSLGGFAQRAGVRSRTDRRAWAEVPGFAEAWVLAERPAIDAGAALPEGLSASVVQRVLDGASSSGGRKHWTLAQRGRQLCLVPGSEPAMPWRRLLTLEVPVATRGCVVSRGGQRRRVAVGSGATEIAALAPGVPVDVELAGHRITLSDLPRPAWASEWGRDERGAYARSPWMGQYRAHFYVDEGRAARGLWPFRERASRDDLMRSRGTGGIPVSLGMGLDERFGPYVDLEINRVAQRFRWIPPGEFWMGSTDEERARIEDAQWRKFRDDESPRHRVRLTQGYWLAEMPCTQALWLALMGQNPSRFKGDLQRPVEQVSFDEVTGFLERLSPLLPEGMVPALPTEAQWEYACRAGTDTAFSFGDQVSAGMLHVNGLGEFGTRDEVEGLNSTQPVGTTPANAWGLRDMHGNVWEWCADGKRRYEVSEGGEVLEDPQGPAEPGPEALRCVRGGSWVNHARYARSAFRFAFLRGFRYGYLGFRLALRSTSTGPQAPEGPAPEPAVPEAPPRARRDAGPAAKNGAVGRLRHLLGRMFERNGDPPLSGTDDIKGSQGKKGKQR